MRDLFLVICFLLVIWVMERGLDNCAEDLGHTVHTFLKAAGG